MNLEVTKVTIVRTSGSTDHVILYLTIPEGIWPYRGNATAKLELARGSAEEYLSKHLPGIPIEVVGT